MKSALNLAIGQIAQIKRFDKLQLEGRFLESGITQNSQISILRRAPANGAFYVKINKSIFAMRPEELAAIILD